MRSIDVRMLPEFHIVMQLAFTSFAQVFLPGASAYGSVAGCCINFVTLTSSVAVIHAWNIGSRVIAYSSLEWFVLWSIYSSRKSAFLALAANTETNSRALNLMLSNIGHDLLTPLQVRPYRPSLVTHSETYLSSPIGHYH